MSLESLSELFLHELKDVYNAEKQIIKALPKMAKAANDPKLKRAFQNHLAVTKGQVDRLEDIFSHLGTPARGTKCAGMEGLLEEGAKMMEEDGDPAVLDAGLISSAQRVEHYEIAAYGCLVAFAEQLGDKVAVNLLKRTLGEEESADKELSKLAATINRTASLAAVA